MEYLAEFIFRHMPFDHAAVCYFYLLIQLTQNARVALVSVEKRLTRA